MDIMTKQLLEYSKHLIEAIEDNETWAWEASLEADYRVVVRNTTSVDDTTPDDVECKIKEFAGIDFELDRLKKLVEQIDEHNKTKDEILDTEEYLEKHEYKLIEFAIDDIVDRVLNETSEDLDDYDLDSVTDYVTELVEAGVDALWGVKAIDGDEEYWMDEADIDNAFDNIIRDMEDIHEYIRTGGF